MLTLTSSQASMIEHAAVQGSHAAVQETLSFSQRSTRPLDTSFSAEMAMHLLKLQLPNFDRNILKWPKFWDVFKYNQNCQKGSYTCTVSGLILHSHSTDTTTDQQFMLVPLPKLQRTAFTEASFTGLSGVHGCLGGL